MEDFEIVELTWTFFTLIVIGKWLWRNNLGRSALLGCEPPESEFHPLDAILAFIIFIMISGVSGFFVNEESSFENKMVVSSLASLAAAGGLLYLLYQRLKSDRVSFLIGKPLNVILNSLIYSVPAIGLAGIIFAITILICGWFGYENIEKHRYLEEVFGDGSPDITKVVLLYISAGIVTPILEETMFRGLLLNIINKAIGRPWLAIFIAAALFAIMHEDKQHWPALFALGSFFGYSMVKCRSLAVPIVMHAIFNCYTITNALLVELVK